MGRSGRVGGSGGEQPSPEARHVDSGEPGAESAISVAGQALSDEQYALLAPMIPPAKPGGRPRTTDMRRMLDGLFVSIRPRPQHGRLTGSG